jgi:ubiquitin
MPTIRSKAKKVKDCVKKIGIGKEDEKPCESEE